MIYVPNYKDYKCFVVRSEDVIRAYKQVPDYDTNIIYRDYYVNSNYLYNDGYQQFGSYSTLPTCLDNSLITDSPYYRNDFHQILIIVLIMAIFCILIPLKIFLRLFRRFQ